MSPQMSCDFVTLWLCISLIWSIISIPETVSQQQHSRGERQSPRTWMVWDDNKQCRATWSHHCKYCWGVPSTTHDYHWCPPQHCQAEGSSDDLWRQNQFHQWVTHVLPNLFLTKVDDQSLEELSLLEQSSCLIQSRTIRWWSLAADHLSHIPWSHRVFLRSKCSPVHLKQKFYVVVIFLMSLTTFISST